MVEACSIGRLQAGKETPLVWAVALQACTPSFRGGKSVDSGTMPLPSALEPAKTLGIPAVLKITS